MIDGGYCGVKATTVINLTTESPTIERQGKGDTGWLVDAA